MKLAAKDFDIGSPTIGEDGTLSLLRKHHYQGWILYERDKGQS